MGESVDVVVVGAGLSGLLTARELKKAGADVLVLEARDRIGGRLTQITRPDGRTLEAGGELTGPAATEMQALAAELGIAVEPLAPFANGFENMGLLVRVFDGERLVEPYPFAADEAAGEAYGAAVGMIDELAAQVPVDAPWDHPDAYALDHTSVGAWLDENVPNAAARHMLELDLWTFVDLNDLSLLYVLWFVGRYGGWEGYTSLHDSFAGGTAQFPRRLAEEVGNERIRLSAPVRRIAQDADGVTVTYDGGEARAGAVVVAMEPSVAGKIEYEPRLPTQRDLLQDRWAAVGATKYWAIYDRPFWRDEGLAGVAFGPFPIPVAFDVSPLDGSEGVLLTAFTASGADVATHGDLLRDPEQAQAFVLDRFASFFGEEARHPKEFHIADWTGDRWMGGAGTALNLGVLTSVGRSLNPPVGRIVWAGSENGDKEWLEGAVSSAYRAAREARELSQGRVANPV